MKLFKQLEDMFAMSGDDIQRAFNARISKLGLEGVWVNEVETDIGGDALVTFVDEDNDSMEVLFTYDPDEGAIAVVLEEDEFDDVNDEEDIDFVDLDALGPKLIDMGGEDPAIDLINLNWLSESALMAILNIGDFLDDDKDSDSTVDEASTVVVRGGKKVRLALVRRKRKKRLTPKQKAGFKKAARKRKAKSGQISRKRKKSLKLRKRSGLKVNKNKRLKVRN